MTPTPTATATATATGAAAEAGETPGDLPYVVYRYDFPDGSAYVGHTRRPLHQRHYAHSAQPSNRYLLHQMARWPEVRPSVVSRHPDDLAAIGAERAVIAGLERPLNSVWLSTQRYIPPGCERLPSDDPAAWSLQGRGAGGRIRKRKRRYPRATTGMYRCRICYQSKPPDDYYSGAARSSGLSSRCRDCSRVIARLMGAAARRHEDTSRAYYAAVDAIRSGDIEAQSGGVPLREERYGEDGLWLCLLCRSRKPRDDYHIHLGHPRSRCRQCLADIYRLVSRGVRGGACRADAHRSAVAAIRREKSGTSAA